MNKTIKVETLRNFFHLACLTLSGTLIIYWIYEFSLNKDLCSISYKRYHDTNEDSYPLLSLCFKNFISESELQKQNPPIKLSSYLDFLKGNSFDSNLSNIDYKSITKNISDYLIKYFVEERDVFGPKWVSKNKDLFELSYVGRWSHSLAFLTCHSLKIQQKSNFKLIQIFLSNSIFPNKTRNPENGMITVLHYPNQILSSGNPIRWSWSRRENYNKFVMRFKVDNIEVIKRRNKARQPCHENWKHYDDAVLEEYLSKTGCRLSFHKMDANLSLCSNASGAAKDVWMNSPSIEMTNNIQPCRSMIKMDYRFEETYIAHEIEKSEQRDELEHAFSIKLSFNNPYFKEITQER